MPQVVSDFTWALCNTVCVCTCFSVPVNAQTHGDSCHRRDLKWGSSDQRFWETIKACMEKNTLCVLHWEEASVWSLSDSCPSLSFSHLHTWSLELDHQLLGQPLSKALLSSVWLVVSSRKSPGLSKLLSFKNYWGHCALQCWRMFLAFASTQSLSSAGSSCSVFALIYITVVSRFDILTFSLCLKGAHPTSP